MSNCSQLGAFYGCGLTPKATSGGKLRVDPERRRGSLSIVGPNNELFLAGHPFTFAKRVNNINVTITSMNRVEVTSVWWPNLRGLGGQWREL
jgi:hypothetical protein